MAQVKAVCSLVSINNPEQVDRISVFDLLLTYSDFSARFLRFLSVWSMLMGWWFLQPHHPNLFSTSSACFDLNRLAVFLRFTASFCCYSCVGEAPYLTWVAFA